MSEILPPEIEEGNVEYKLKLGNLSDERLEQLTTQLKWRLAEGHGEALYQLGVSDAGVLVGLTRTELKDSLTALDAMAKRLDAEISIIRERTVDGAVREQVDRKRAARERKGKHLESSGDKRLLDEEKLVVLEVLVRRKNLQHFLEVRLVFLGYTESGKSTLLGYLAHSELDNGIGKARLNLLRHRHELKTGRSSSISHTIIGFSPQGELLNYGTSTKHVGTAAIRSQNSEALTSTKSQEQLLNISGSASNHFPSKARDSLSVQNSGNWCEAQIVDNSSKILMLIDTCGHPKYLKTTLQGLTGYNPDYACLVVDGLQENIDSTTKEVFGCALVLAVPVFVVITKVDLANDERSKERFENTVKCLLKLLMMPGSTKVPVIVQNEDEAIVSVQNFVGARVIPIFLLSCVSGENTNLLVKFLNLLPSRGSFVLPNHHGSSATPSKNSITSSNASDHLEFPIEDIFNVPSVGTVVGGRLVAGNIQCLPLNFSSTTETESHNLHTNGRPLFLGPVDKLHGRFIPIRIRSIHRQRRPCNFIYPGQSASLALADVDRAILRKGMVILDHMASGCFEFEAEMLILYAPDNYSIQHLNMIKDSDSALNGRKRRISLAALDSYLEDDGPENCFIKKKTGVVHIGNVHQRVYMIHAIPGAESAQSSTSKAYVTGDRVRIRFRFSNQREYLRSGMRVLYREDCHGGNYGAKMAGEVIM